MKLCAQDGKKIPISNIFGESFFHHDLHVERLSMSYFQDPITPNALEKVLQERLSAAYQAEALCVKYLRKVAIDTTIQEKAIAHPTGHGLMLKGVMKFAEVRLVG